MVERGKTWSEASLEFRDAIEVFQVPLEPKFYNAFKNFSHTRRKGNRTVRIIDVFGRLTWFKERDNNSDFPMIWTEAGYEKQIK
jgi:hypothetical protein